MHRLVNPASPTASVLCFPALSISQVAPLANWPPNENPSESEYGIVYQTVPTIAACHGVSRMDHGSLSRWKIAWKYPNLSVLLCCSQRRYRRRNYVKSWRIWRERTQRRRYNPEPKWGRDVFILSNFL
jgi:hypothetical protein